MKHDVQNFQKEVIERSHQTPVLVDFWAEWCGPCRILGPVLEKLTEENNGRWVLAKVNTEEHQDLAVQYQIRSIPNVKLFVDGTIAGEFAGALPEHMVRQWLEKQLPSKYAKMLEKAEKLLGVHGLEEAHIILKDIIAHEPKNQKARVLLGKSLLFEEPQEAVGLVEGIEEDSDHFQIVDAIRTYATLQDKVQAPEAFPDSPINRTYREAIQALKAKKFEEALQKFIEVIRTDRYYDEDGARKACIAIFKILGEDNPLTQQYRREFSSTLYI